MAKMKFAYCKLCDSWYIGGKWKKSGFVMEWLEITAANKKGQVLVGICKKCKAKKRNNL